MMKTSIKELHRQGAHFVLTKSPKGPEAKQPLWRRWNRSRPSADEVYGHWAYYTGNIGVIPGSLSSAVLDIDAGSPGAISAFPYSATLRSLSGKYHLWYRARRLPGRKYNGLSFPTYQIEKADLITRSGYVVIADPMKDLDALLSLPKVDLPPPLAELVAQELEQVSGGGEPIIGPRPRAVVSVDHVPDTDFTQVYPGSRNATLFHYLQRCPLSLVADYDTCLGLARKANALIPKPLPDAEVKRTAESIHRNKAKYSEFWSRERGREWGIKSGEARRARNAERDAEIIRLLDQGVAKKAIARQFGLTPAWIRGIERRTL